MRQTIYVFLMSILAGSAGAHTLSADAGIFARLGHVLFSPHHLPLLLLMLVVGLFVTAGLGRAANARSRKTRSRSR